MKINNVEKFREELYKAIEDAEIWDRVGHVAATWKGATEDYRESMTEYNHYEMKNENVLRVSLAHPMSIMKDGNVIYITVEENGVNFYHSTMEEFEYRGHLDAGNYKNKLSFMIALVDTINWQLGKQERS